MADIGRKMYRKDFLYFPPVPELVKCIKYFTVTKLGANIV